MDEKAQPTLNSASHKTFLWALVIICITVFSMFALYRFTGNSINEDKDGPTINIGDKECPYECCSETGLKAKACDAGFICRNNVCKEMDSDNDGLTDIEEKNLGTNPNLYDSDADTLSDYQEVKSIGTNPLNPNTDGDRYNDNIDQSPSTKDSAKVSATIAEANFNIQWLTLGVAVVGGGIVNPSMVIAKPSITASVANEGTDYSSYLDYDVVVYVASEELKRYHQTRGKIDRGFSNTERINFEIKAEDVPSILMNAITNKNTQWEARIENVDFEKF